MEPQPHSFQGQYALVTGAASGIGRACALALAEAGAGVAVNHLPRSADKARKVVREIEARGGRAIAAAADVRRADEVERMFSEVLERFGALHILVNNAGVQDDAPFQQMSLEQWNKVLDTDLTGQFLCAQQAVRLFELREGRDFQNGSALGKIICMSSVHQAIPWAGHVNYAAAKGGVRLLMETMAQELAPKKIRVNAVAPGAICTDINRPVWENEEKRHQLLTLIPYGRIGTPEDVAHAVVWLASDESDYITGTTLTVDGGMMLYPAFRGNG
jgi:glucose 1-dehydrogenase